MNVKNGLLILATVLVGGVIVAGQTLGWGDLLGSIINRAHILASSAVRPNPITFLAGEKVWLTLEGVQTDRVYWLFDEGKSPIRGGIQFQHSFPFDDSAPAGIKRMRRIDAFFRTGDSYSSVHALINVDNTKIQAMANVKHAGFEIIAESDIEGEWKLVDVSLAKFEDGKFNDKGAEPVLSVGDGKHARALMSYSKIKSDFGYTSVKEAQSDLSNGESFWISLAYKPIKGGKTLTVLKRVKEAMR